MISRDSRARDASQFKQSKLAMAKSAVERSQAAKPGGDMPLGALGIL